MRCPCGFLCLLALPLVLGAGAPVEPARKEFLQFAVRGDSGTAQEFRILSQGFHVGGRLGRALERPVEVNDTLSIIGAGTVELLSADSSKVLSVDVWMASPDRKPTVRYTGRVVKIERASVMTPYVVTTR